MAIAHAHSLTLALGVGGQVRTVDQDFEARKAEYGRFAKEYALLWRRLEQYFKQIKEVRDPGALLRFCLDDAHVQQDAKNWDAITQSTRSVYNGADSSMCSLFESLAGQTQVWRSRCKLRLFVFNVFASCTQEGLAAYDTEWQRVKEMLTKYDAMVKHMGRRIEERDGSRLDFDRLRTKWEK